MCKDAPSINHLLFADDSFLFARGNLYEFQNIKDCLRTYEKASGQAVNFDKSWVAFSSNLNEVDQQTLVICLQVRRVNYQDRYLGLSVFV